AGVKVSKKRRVARAKASHERRAGANTQIHAVVATYINAWGSPDPELRNLDATNVDDRVRRFHKRNPEFAKVIDRNPLAYVKEETGLDVPSAPNAISDADK